MLSPLLLIKHAASHPEQQLRNFYPRREGGSPQDTDRTADLVDELWEYHSRTVGPDTGEEHGESMPTPPPSGGVQA